MALGSNVGQVPAMAMALEMLSCFVPDGKRTDAVWTEPIGIKSGRFLNCLFCGRTPMPLDELNRMAKRIERQCGRTSEEAAAGLIRMDIDILEYAGRRYHAADWERKYIKRLMRDI